MMNILVLSAFPEEQTYYKENLEIVSSSKIGFIDVTACKAESNTIYLACTGMGTINASLVLATLAARLAPDAVFFSGTAGAIDPALHKGDVVIGQEAFDADILAVHDAVLGTPFEGALLNPNKREKTPHSYYGNHTLIKQAERLQSQKPGFFFGKIATSNHFPAPKDLFEQIKSSNALIIDMESAAIYQFGWLTKLPALVVRAVSNSLDVNGEDEAVADSDISSSENAAKLVLDCIQAITLQPSVSISICQ